MRLLPTVRQRVTGVVLVYSVIVTIVVVIHGYQVNERAEALAWNSLLENEFAHFLERHMSDPDYRWTDTKTLRLYGPPFGDPIPAAFSNLPEGIHDEIPDAGSQFIALVRNIDNRKHVLSLDISALEHSERNLALTLALWTAPTIAILAVLGYLIAGWLGTPLSSIANSISDWSPTRRDQRLTIARKAPKEARTIAAAFNAHSEKLERFIERERSFINMASHELRTPLSVISGTVDVLLDTNSSTPETRHHLERLQQTSRDMEKLIALLLALAKEPSTLAKANEAVNLAHVIRSVVQDHQYLAKLKELTLATDVEHAQTIHAPLQVVKAAIGNLVRNAIENSDRGTITVAAGTPASITVTDPGHGMSDREKGELYTRLARSGETGNTGDGIGIELIARLCKQLGWCLRFESHASKGTVASLEFMPR
jgi:signal transduction histidine kinase